MHVIFQATTRSMAPEFRIDRVRAQVAGEAPAAITPDIAPSPPPAEAEPQDIEEDDEEDESDEEEAEAAEPSAEGAEDAERRRRRRRRRRRGGRRDEAVPQPEPVAAQTGAGTEAEVADAEETGDEEQAEGASETAEEGEATGDEEGAGRGRRRGRRGGRRRRREGADQALSAVAEPGADQPDLPPVYQGPTPANPFGGQAFDIFEVMERAEEQSEFSTPLRETSEPAAPAQTAEPEPEPAATPAEPDPVASLAEPEPAASSPEASSPEAALAVAEPANLPQTTADDSAANQHEATVEPTESKVAETVGLVESTEMAEAAHSHRGRARARYQAHRHRKRGGAGPDQETRLVATVAAESHAPARHCGDQRGPGPDSIFPGPDPLTELHAGGGAVQRHAAGAHPRHPATRGRTGRPAPSARA